MIAAGNVETPGGEVSPFRAGEGEQRHHAAETTPAGTGEGDETAQ